MTFGFIILRHVRCPLTNLYWQTCHDRIRRYHPEHTIVIIDDNSAYEFVTRKELANTIIIQSEFPARGELLPYYYFLRFAFFDTAVIIHDSVFLNAPLDFESPTTSYKLLWEFDSNDYTVPEKEIGLIRVLDNHEELLELYHDRRAWVGCFGVMTMITHAFLRTIDARYGISNLLPSVTSRDDRMALERVWACMLQANAPKETLFGNILKYCAWGYTFYDFVRDQHILTLPLIKVWSAR